MRTGVGIAKYFLLLSEQSYYRIDANHLKCRIMKNFTWSLIAILCTMLVLTSCGNDAAVREKAAESVEAQRPPSHQAAPVLPTAPMNTPTVSGSVAHYICPNNCEGSGGPAQGNCPVCGTAYLHNQAYHNQSTPTTTTTTVTPPTPPPADASPAQNAAGVYHYVCSNGCAGGAGAAGNCATCGSALTHNSAYHN